MTKHLQRYMRYAKAKYEKMRVRGKGELWEILKQYEYIMQQEKCMQMYIYDWIKGESINKEQYIITSSIDGETYIKECMENYA